MSAKSPKSTAKTTRTTEEPTMKTTTEQTAILTIDSVRSLSGDALQQAHVEVMGEAPKPRTPTPVLRNRIIAELERRAADVEPAQEEPASEPAPLVDTIAAAVAITAAAAIAIDEDEPASEQPALDVAPVVEQPGIEDAPVASDTAVDAPASEPAPIAAAATDDAPVANTDAPARESAATDARDMILARLRAMEPAVQRVMLEGYSKPELLGLVERATGAKTSGRLSPASAIDRILAALTPAPAAEDKPATESDASADAGDTSTSNTSTTTTRGRAAELPAVGTVLENTDRHGKVRARCTVVEGGVEFAGQKFTSLSAAAIAASRALGNTTKQTSGPRFWGLIEAKPRAKTTKELDLDVIERAWDKFRERAEAAVKDATAEDRERLHRMLSGQSTTLASLTAAAVASTEQTTSA